MATSHPASLTAPEVTYRSVTAEVTAVPLEHPSARGWWICFAASVLGVGVFLVQVSYLFYAGVGIWGINAPVYWGFAITSYVWWISMAHAGTMISALLLLLNQGWRNALNRFAEAMTVFAVVQAGLMPILHLGRPWLFYWLLPYPSTMQVWPQFRSPLSWDMFGVLAYFIVSVLFWYVGLIPDLASVRDRAKRRWTQVFYGVLALGWRNSAIHWRRWQITYWTCGALTVALVVMVESTVSLLFASGIEPGWHTTVYPPFFLIGAVFEGFAVILLITIAVRAAYGLHAILTERHLDQLAKLLLAFGMMSLYGWVFENFSAWYTGDPFERQTLLDRWFDIYAFEFWGAALCNFVLIQALWWQPFRRRAGYLAVTAVLVVVGMFLEHFMEIASGLYRDFLPAAWHVFVPSIWEWALLIGTIGLFFFLFFLFVRLLPMISMFELKEALHGDEEAS